MIEISQAIKCIFLYGLQIIYQNMVMHISCHAISVCHVKSILLMDHCGLGWYGLDKLLYRNDK